ncbi:MAG: gamma carbonic anhydrase family protein [Promethearchaeota archaeon]
MSGKKPRISKDAFVASTAVIIGDVTIEAGANIWYGAVLRGDIGPIHVGKNTSIQENVTLHVEENLGCTIGDNVIVGHQAMVHGPCNVGDCAMIGINAVVLQHTTIGKGTMVASSATARKEIPPMKLVVGTPAKVKKDLPEERIEQAIEAAKHYAQFAQKFKDAGLNHPNIEPYLF